VRLLLDELDEWPDDCYALQAASISGYEVIVKLLLDRGADINAEGEVFDALERSDWYGTALQAASKKGHAPVVRLLLDEGADIDVGRGEWTSLYVASVNGHDAVVGLLLDKGAEINAPGRSQRTCTACCISEWARGGRAITAEQRSRYQFSGRDGSNRAAGSASEGGHETVVRLLLDKGADIASAQGECGTALQAASGGWPRNGREITAGQRSRYQCAGRMYEPRCRLHRRKGTRRS
jgi:ankyrin repeat protein